MVSSVRCWCGSAARSQGTTGYGPDLWTERQRQCAMHARLEDAVAANQLCDCRNWSLHVYNRII